MGRTGSIKHTHQYFKRPDGLWACSGIEGCTHFMPKNMLPSPAGRMSICWGCQQEFQLTPANMTVSQPMCEKCGEKVDILDDYINKKFAKPTGLAAFGARSIPTSDETDRIKRALNGESEDEE